MISKFQNIKRRLLAKGSFFVGGALILGGCSLTPEPLTVSQVTDLTTHDLLQIKDEQEVILLPVSLEEAIARGIKYNLNSRLASMKEALSQNELDGAKLGLLPTLATSAGYAWRSKPDTSNSSTVGGSESTSFSYSDLQRSWEGDLTMSWNVLDFGVSYFQAKQQGNRNLISRERKRRVVHNLIMEIRTAYWRAAAASLMEARVDEAMKKARTALKRMQTILKEALDEPINIYRAQKSLIETIARLDGIRGDLAKAMPKLASLMNLRPGTAFVLAVSARDTYKAPIFPLALDKMESVALTYRPELREAEYESRISIDETKKTFARMFPGIELSFGREFTNNSFKNHPAWYNAGVQVTWNLLNILSLPNRLERTETQEAIARTQRMALNLSVLAQTHVSYRDFYNNVRQYEYAKRLWVLDQKIKQNSEENYANEMESLLEGLRSEVNVVQTELQFFDAYSTAQNGLGRLYASLGLDPLPKTLDDLSVKGISKAIAGTFVAWNKGSFPWNKLKNAPTTAALEKSKGSNPELKQVKDDETVVSSMWSWVSGKW